MYRLSDLIFCEGRWHGLECLIYSSKSPGYLAADIRPIFNIFSKIIKAPSLNLLTIDNFDTLIRLI